MKADLTLQKVWFYVQNSIRIMDNLKRLVVEAGNKKGGALLNVIYKLMISTDESIFLIIRLDRIIIFVYTRIIHLRNLLQLFRLIIAFMN